MACQPNPSYGGLSNYGGASFAIGGGGGLANYGQSFSSENLDFNNLPAYPSQQQCFSYPQQQQSQQIDVNDPLLLQQIDQIVSSLADCRRPMLRRQVITVPSQCQGRVANICRRLPTPPPDVIERITVIKPPRDVINLCIEKPCAPGPCLQERTVCGKPRKPLIQPCVVQVPPRPQCCPQPQPCCPQPQQSYGGFAGSTQFGGAGYY